MGNALTKRQGRKGNKSPIAADVADTTNLCKEDEDFRYDDGRKYNNAENSKYLFPNDDEECDRLHMQHFVLRYAWQSNFVSPVELILNSKDAKVLDVGYILL